MTTYENPGRSPLLPMYRLLVIAPPAPRLLEGRGSHLTEISVLPSRRRTEPLGQGRRKTRSRYRAVLSAAEALLDQAIAANGELPLVVVGSPHLVEVFRMWSRHTPSLMGEASGWYPQATVYQLADVAQPALDLWDASRRDHALEAPAYRQHAHNVKLTRHSRSPPSPQPGLPL